MEVEYFKNNLIHLNETPSTNNEAFNIGEKCAVWADRQSSGRGRNGKSFISNNEDGLWFSLLEKDVLDPEITAWTAVSVCKILKANGLDTKIKWPNDILLNEKKICGILCEMRNNAVVIGIGINLYQKDFGDLNDIAISAKQASCFIDKQKLLLQLLDALDQMLIDYPKNRQNYLDYYKSNSAILDRDIICEGKIVKVKDFDEHFALIIEDGGKLRTINSGEISIKLK